VVELNALPGAAMIVNSALEVIDCNTSALKVLGLPIGEHGCERLTQALAQEQTELGDSLALATASLSTGEEERFAWRHGDYRFEVSISLRADDDSEYLVMLSDRTGEMLTQDIQVNARHYLEHILGQIPVGVVVLDSRSRITSANTQMLCFFEKLAGVGDLLSVIGSTLLELLPESPGGRWHSLCEAVLIDAVPTPQAADEEKEEKGSYSTNDGDLDLTTEVTPLRDQTGTLSGAILMATDITERARLEHEVMRMEKLATVGQMVVTINHEINNPLLIISTNAQAMRLMNPDFDDKTTKKLLKIEEQVKRISLVTEQLRSLDEVSSQEYIAEGPQMIDLWGDSKKSVEGE